VDDRLLGLILWHAGRWWLRRRLRHTRRKAAIAGLLALVVIGVLAWQRQPADR
jgi:hypothetical protein